MGTCVHHVFLSDMEQAFYGIGKAPLTLAHSTCRNAIA